MHKKTVLLALVGALALIPLARAADVTAKINNVHLCCDKCVKGAEKAVGTVEGATAVVDKSAGTVVITAADAATVQKAADALVKAGFYGDCSDAGVKINSETGAKGEKVQTLKVDGVHICCPKCVKALKKVLADVPGVTGDTVTNGEKSFTVTGDFKDSDVFDALQKAGFTGKVGQ